MTNPSLPAAQELQDRPLLKPDLDGLLEVLQLALCLGQQPSGAQLLLQQNLPQQLPQLAAWLLRTTGEPHIDLCGTQPPGSGASACPVHLCQFVGWDADWVLLSCYAPSSGCRVHLYESESLLIPSQATAVDLHMHLLLDIPAAERALLNSTVAPALCMSNGQAP